MNPIIMVCGCMLFGASVARAQGPVAEAPAAPAATASPSVSPAPVPGDEQQLLTIEQEWSNAYLHGDAEYLARLFTDDFVSTNARAELTNKEDELREVRDRSVHYTVYESHDMTVHIHGDAAVVTGRVRLKGTVSASGKLTETETRFTNTFVRTGGQWHALAVHVSRVDGYSYFQND